MDRSGAATRVVTESAVSTVAAPSEEVIDRICARLRVLPAFRMAELDGLRPKGLGQRDWRLMVHEATQRLLAEHIVFSPKGGVYRRATCVEQVQRRASRHASAALRKLERAVKIEAASAPLAETPEDRLRVERRELKRENAVLSAKAALHGAGVPRPKGI